MRITRMLRNRERFSRRVSIDEIEKNGYNLDIYRYVSTSFIEIKIDLQDIDQKLASINESNQLNTDNHNEFLKKLGLPMI